MGAGVALWQLGSYKVRIVVHVTIVSGSQAPREATNAGKIKEVSLCSSGIDEVEIR